MASVPEGPHALFALVTKFSGFYEAHANVFVSERVLKCNENRFLCKEVSYVLHDQHSFPHGFCSCFRLWLKLVR